MKVTIESISNTSPSNHNQIFYLNTQYFLPDNKIPFTYCNCKHSLKEDLIWKEAEDHEGYLCEGDLIYSISR